MPFNLGILDPFEDCVAGQFGVFFRDNHLRLPPAHDQLGRCAGNPKRETSTTIANASRVNWPQTNGVLIRQPSLKAAESESRFQRSFRPSSQGIGLRAPMARLLTSNHQHDFSAHYSHLRNLLVVDLCQGGNCFCCV